ncbi:glycosyltransferase family 39 protein [Micromonospora sp. PLK6-60]|uniref:glycosyltransferase family 39 protein n=1 Tax=Micromonospora sp. PLK6-60 TaxID=2873383 RepID=UPI001CA6A337|nr:glycosyltransferase family 39 protein [Micromonospora sp. PLK6-60]MBY8874547.1 glycosyltransferase family 39 protein [Micromonospora sp. PLK6-60]
MTDAETMVLPRSGLTELGVEDPWGEDHGPGGEPEVDSARWRLAAWLVPALLMGGLGLLRGGGPVLPGAAETESAAPLFHLIMRTWVGAFGTSDLALRVPSTVAAVAAAAMVGALATRLYAPRVGLLAGVIFALLPTSALSAQQAQPYPLAVLAAVFATWCLVRATDRPGPGPLAVYGAAVLILGSCHLVALLLVVGHGWVVLAFRRSMAGWWLLVTAVGVSPAAATVLLGPGRGTWPAPGVAAGSAELAAAPRELFGVAALGAVLFLLALFSLPLRRGAAVCTAWAVLPPVVLLLAAQAAPVWQPRYLLFTLPAWAILGAVALSRVRAGWAAAALVAIAVLAVSVHLDLREPAGPQRAGGRLARIVEDWTRPADPPVAARPAPNGRAGGGATPSIVAGPARS